MIGLAIVGCGFVADFYQATLANHPLLELVGVFDRDPGRAEVFARRHGVRQYGSLDEALSDGRVSLVVNLTNPSSHHEVSRTALLAGRHVYSEKPLATTFEQAQDLVELAEERGLHLASAPCTVLGEAAQTAWKALRDGRIGTPRVAYAEMDDGPVPLEDHASWRSPSGLPWPARDEFEVGCTLEHSGYGLTWLMAFFGPARSVTAFSAVVLPDKGLPLQARSPDFSVAAIEFGNGVVARLTCGIFATPDRRLRVFGDRGVLTVADSWNFASPVLLGSRTPIGLRAEKHPGLARWLGLGPRRVRPVRHSRFRWAGHPANRIDFARGVADVAAAVSSGGSPALSARWSLHVTELALAIQDPGAYGKPHALRSTFPPMPPMSWAV